MPDISYILFNGTVRSKLTAVGNIDKSCFCPPLSVSVSLVDLLMSLCIGTEIFQDKVSIRTAAATVI